VYDPPETAYIKRLLQHGLPLRVRGEIVDILFRRHVTADEAAFSRELYMNADQLRDLQGAGMELGGHGVRHEHLGLLPVEQQVRELCGTRAFLKELSGGVLREWSMCFPYGSYNDATLRVAAHLGCALAVSVRPGLTRLPLVDAADPIPVLDRLDTNDLPYKIATGAEDSACDWTRRVGAL
jgi:peptidoglycan/xylan/chitin deacetylase (PgdA/CDA1 family)